jgi:transcriptional regulator with XRE-family HTH domain
LRAVKRLRLEKGWSQKDLADKSGVGQDTISGVESGKHEPRPSTLRKLAGALDTEVSNLFEEVVTRPKVEPPLLEEVDQRRRSKATEARRIAEEINLPPDLDSGNIVDVLRDVEEADRRRDKQQLRRVVESGERQTNYGSVAEEFEHRLEDFLGWTFFGGFMYSGLLSAVRRILDLEEENARLRGEVEAPEKVRSE